ncbi:MAG: hypothetical protein A2539_02750 [Elusimicrobia bacterium RIFOXYD2_FULL_34_15]|nr:MAG: hypothetical protein A2539_02750 [Elusimicrobia bacterium RIFOXYD2_FULL_34_15]
MGKNKILIVEDDKDIVELFKVGLDGFGYKVSFAFDGKQALEMVKNEIPDLIILDVILPYLDGFGVCAELKMDKETKKIPILMCTSQNSLADVEKGFSFGINGYIIKPFDPDKLVAKIKQVLEK